MIPVPLNAARTATAEDLAGRAERGDGGDAFAALLAELDGRPAATPEAPAPSAGPRAERSVLPAPRFGTPVRLEAAETAPAPELAPDQAAVPAGPIAETERPVAAMDLGALLARSARLPVSTPSAAQPFAEPPSSGAGETPRENGPAMRAPTPAAVEAALARPAAPGTVAHILSTPAAPLRPSPSVLPLPDGEAETVAQMPPVARPDRDAEAGEGAPALAAPPSVAADEASPHPERTPPSSSPAPARAEAALLFSARPEAAPMFSAATEEGARRPLPVEADRSAPAPSSDRPEESTPVVPAAPNDGAPSTSPLPAAIFATLLPAPSAQPEAADVPEGTSDPAMVATLEEGGTLDEAPVPSAKVVLCETHFAPVLPREVGPTPPSAPDQAKAVQSLSVALPQAAEAEAQAAAVAGQAATVAAASASAASVSAASTLAASEGLAFDRPVPALSERRPAARAVDLPAQPGEAPLPSPDMAPFEERPAARMPARAAAGAEKARGASEIATEAPTPVPAASGAAATPAPVAAPAGAAPSPAAVQLGSVLAEAVRAEAPGASAASAAMPARGPVRVLEIQLRPLELGLVTVRLRTGRNGLEIHVHAARAETARLLEQDRASLIATLADADAGPLDLTISQTGLPPRLTGEDAFAPVDWERREGNGSREGNSGDSDPRRRRRQDEDAAFRAADGGSADQQP
ncbi:flagellar hook-length control protein FliK [Ancylobacter polymorphus]|uniref:Flagellar hook-length control protein FliK n=1 Tax=Ancylobacter polymorphus TaxID=223390 RepID=A0A9E7D7Y0_9HYPH|nr:flagellar hook-length control protein FliK [Ancylobacter polymorphus]UOK72756.1 flagellar hook-length control protein FliK [Ancylobacter polymorphus]